MSKAETITPING